MRRKTVPNQDTSDLRRSSASQLETTLPEILEESDSAGLDASSYDIPNAMSVASGAAMPLDPALQTVDAVPGGDISRAMRESSATTNGNIAFNDLQNPSDALGILYVRMSQYHMLRPRWQRRALNLSCLQLLQSANRQQRWLRFRNHQQILQRRERQLRTGPHLGAQREAFAGQDHPPAAALQAVLPPILSTGKIALLMIRDSRCMQLT